MTMLARRVIQKYEKGQTMKNNEMHDFIAKTPLKVGDEMLVDVFEMYDGLHPCFELKRMQSRGLCLGGESSYQGVSEARVVLVASEYAVLQMVTLDNAHESDDNDGFRRVFVKVLWDEVKESLKNGMLRYADKKSEDEKYHSQHI